MIKNEFFVYSIYIKNILIDLRYDILIHFSTLIYTWLCSSNKGLVLLRFAEQCSVSLKLAHSCRIIYIHSTSFTFMHNHLHSFTILCIHQQSFAFMHNHLHSFAIVYVHAQSFTGQPHYDQALPSFLFNNNTISAGRKIMKLMLVSCMMMTTL